MPALAMIKADWSDTLDTGIIYMINNLMAAAA